MVFEWFGILAIFHIISCKIFFAPPLPYHGLQYPDSGCIRQKCWRRERVFSEQEIKLWGFESQNFCLWLHFISIWRKHIPHHPQYIENIEVDVPCLCFFFHSSHPRWPPRKCLYPKNIPRNYITFIPFNLTPFSSFSDGTNPSIRYRSYCFTISLFFHWRGLLFCTHHFGWVFFFLGKCGGKSDHSG